MNKKRRELLNKAVKLLDEVSGVVNEALDQEQDCLDNMPENLQMSEKYESMENAVDSMGWTISCIEDAKTYLEDAIR